MNETPQNEASDSMVPNPPAVVAGGRQLGDYSLLELLVDEKETETWRAIQGSVARQVLLELLKPAFAQNAVSLKGFRALVQARAAVVHRFIAPVYEAQEIEGTHFYTRELVGGRDLQQLHAGGVRLAPDQVIRIFSATAEAMEYMDGNQMQRAALSPGAVHLGDDGIPRLDNLATAPAPVRPSLNRQAELQQIGQSLSVLLHRGMTESAAVDTFLKSLIHGGLADWGQAVTQARRLQRSLTQGDSGAEKSAISPQTANASAEAGAKKRGRVGVPVVTSLVCLAILAGGYFALTGGKTSPDSGAFDASVGITAGTISIDGATEEVAAFEIDEYETTIAQYAEFLNSLSALSGDALQQFDHSDQPAAKSGHVPAGWDALFRAAKRGGEFQRQKISLNHPIIAVDWWDAYAYSKWKGRRLPTAAEWHLAALGPDPLARFPWGKRDAPTLYNSGADFDKDGSGGQVDGYNYWAPVNSFSNDRSPLGVYGMAGNVSEWVDTWTPHPEFPDQRVPVVMGGSFAAKIANITERRPAKSADAAQWAVGFRTAQTVK
ncbi:MAG: hypothetical protein ACI9R3_000534 [Verrucomicrobiales bacterium]